MSSKRRDDANVGNTRLQAVAPPPAKRQRVSLACNSCRAAREKCDGGRPLCDACVTQRRSCSYTPASRKRGVPTGYLRTIELSLAWLSEQIPAGEAALHSLLTNNGGAEATRVLGTKAKAGHRLYRDWSKSRVHKAIGHFLSDDKTLRIDDSAEDSETDDTTSPTSSHILDAKRTPGVEPQGFQFPQQHTPPVSHNVRIPANSPANSRLILPPNWERLVDIYLTYTHCWLPIVEEATITETALTYPPEGLDLDPNNSAFPSHALLWAVLSVAAFQNSASPERSLKGSLKPAQIFQIARDLVPRDNEEFETPYVCALLLHSLVLLGQRKSKAAWRLIGNASRLALGNLPAASYMNQDGDGTQMSPNNLEMRVLISSFILDTLVSLRLGLPQSQTGIRYGLSSATACGYEGAEETWTPITGMGSKFKTSMTSIQPLAAFQQLFTFCKLWSGHAEQKLHDPCGQSRATPEDLARCLDSRFSFCSSLIFDGSTPGIPSAFLLQGVFLCITLDLVPGHRPSLFSNLVELLDSCQKTFGASGTPPIMATLMEITHQHGHAGRMYEHDKPRWTRILHDVDKVWSFDAGDTGGNIEQQTLAGRAVDGPSIEEEERDNLSNILHHSIRAARAPNTLQGSQPTIFSPLHPQQHHVLPYDFQSSAIYAGPLVPSSALQNNTARLGSGSASESVDYDAILDELDCVVYADNSMDMDSQFMANLGFGPGATLGEMFHPDF
ncbi:hypothetical protein G7046_g5402 [Stylonectria norvegica]|nr:hypothetical protein G7046_g5402 [Stylonectria norvegica]